MRKGAINDGTSVCTGSGASKAVTENAPLNDQLLPGIFEMYPPSALIGWSEDFNAKRVEAVVKFVCDFYPGGIDPLNVDENRLPPLENVLTQLDYCIGEQRPLSETYSVATLRQLREDLIYALYKVLKWKLGSHNHGPMEEFVRQLSRDDVIVCLNYDLIVDNALVNSPHPREIDYGIPLRLPGTRGHLIRVGHGRKLLKPHGSLNWLYCPLCQQIDVFQGEKAVGRIFRETDQAKCDQCRVRYDPIIITPTFLKTYKNSFVTQIWQATEAALRAADEIVFIGYSLPDAD